mmetsp:Transcript_33561/g.38557  ORF Transcript_33561/g.38557 Transcript_33561/m.38557 type:complete len:110 (-) Transcript_33561:98-427(-)
MQTIHSGLKFDCSQTVKRDPLNNPKLISIKDSLKKPINIKESYELSSNEYETDHQLYESDSFKEDETLSNSDKTDSTESLHYVKFPKICVSIRVKEKSQASNSTWHSTT